MDKHMRELPRPPATQGLCAETAGPFSIGQSFTARMKTVQKRPGIWQAPLLAPLPDTGISLRQEVLQHERHDL